MHHLRRLRSTEVLHLDKELLYEMAFDNRLFRGLNPQESSASIPSMRASAPPEDTTATNGAQDGGNVKVVVRVREFIPREIQVNAKCVVEMDAESQKTRLLATDATGKSRRPTDEREFVFDKSFCSFDRADAQYADQKTVYESFASDFLAHNFDGFHTCIFAYGQTGSGKSYTMMGPKEAPGLIPQYCQALFQRIQQAPDANTTYNVHVSYFEIYNEHVRDLLIPVPFHKRHDEPKVHYLKIRESPQQGVYIPGLTDVLVKSYADIEKHMAVGDKNRTVAETKMNQSSSRSHAVFTITLKQIEHCTGSDETIERTARMRLVDLAGSERASKTEAKGQRLLEGGKINKSLSTLGRVIAALADPKRQAMATGASGSGRNSPRPGSRPSSARGLRPFSKSTLEVVPYRDSVLTWLLKDSLGGNSKTAMVACISPSLSDYDETLSTLRYADQAKRIRTRATANVDSISAAARDAEIFEMSETIKILQFSLTSAKERKQEEIDMMEMYQDQVYKMQRLMEETRQIGETRLKAAVDEIEVLKPENDRMKGEIEALRRHLGLVTLELTNPIVIPPDLMIDTNDQGESDIIPGEAASYYDANNAAHDDGMDLLEDLKMFRRKCMDDTSVF
ncbi:kinesin, partial [Tothia fuscella]